MSVQWLLVPYLLLEEYTIGKGLQDTDWSSWCKLTPCKVRGSCGREGGRDAIYCVESSQEIVTINISILWKETLMLSINIPLQWIFSCPAIGFLLTVKYIVSKVESYCVYSTISFRFVGLICTVKFLVNCNKSWGKYSINFQSVRSFYSFLRKIIKLMVQINQFTISVS